MGLFSFESPGMTRGPKKHLKRLNAPRHWMLDKLSGVWAPKPSPGPHKTRECIPLVILLRNRLKYAITRREVMLIAAQRLVQVDNKVRTDTRYPIGFMDVVGIPKTGENFRLLYDVKGRFNIHRISLKKPNSSCARLLTLVLDENPFLTSLPTMDEPSDTLIPSSNKMIPSNFLWNLTQSLDMSPLMLEILL